MSRRSAGLRVKEILRHLGVRASVRLGRGTAHSWVYIATAEEVPEGVREVVEGVMRQEKLCGSYLSDCGSYLSDCGPGDDWRPCVLWETR